tara:strand:- start:3431 stop:3760 length:330 start_codon:yes stop_codon:yes gene_type:complete
VLRWYCLRWRIEEWHRVLKTGCKVDELSHQSAARLSRAISIRMLMTLLGRESFELSPDLLFTDVELRVLRHYAMKRKGKEIHTLKMRSPGRRSWAATSTANTPRHRVRT